MTKRSMLNASSTPAANRAELEEITQQAAKTRNGTKRRRKNREKTVIFRLTDVEHKMFFDLADLMEMNLTDTFVTLVEEKMNEYKGK